MSLIVKICGISTAEALAAAIEAGADMVGLMFFPPSPRFLGLGQATDLAGRARGKAGIVAVTVDMDDAGLAEIVSRIRPDWLQFHGKEPPERVAEARKRFGLPIMKAIGVRHSGDLALAAAYLSVADRLLVDASPPKGAVLPGGNGEPFDWHILQGFAPTLPYLLSGGLDPGNIGEAVGISNAPGVDVSSGVETVPGRKDPDLIRAFIAAARRAEVRRREGVPA